MEVADFLRLTKRRVAALVALAVLAAVPVVFYAASRPSTYQATAAVNLTPLASGTASDDEQTRQTSDYGVALTLASTFDSASAATGVPGAEIKRGLVYESSPSGFIVAVRFQAHSPTQTRNVLTAVSTRALIVLSDQAVAVAQGAEVVGARQVEAAAQALGRYLASPAGAGVRRTQLAAEVSQLQLLTGPTSANRATVAQLDTVLQKTLADPVLSGDPVYMRLASAMNVALGQWQQSYSAYVSAAQTRSLESSNSLVTVGPAVKVSDLRTIALDGFALGSVTMLLATAGIARLEFRQRRRSGRGQPVSPAATHPDGARPTGVTLGTLLRPRRVELLLLALVPVSVLGAVGVLHLAGVRKSTLALIMAVPVGVAAGSLALKRFEWLLAFLLVVRTSLDALNIDSLSKGGGVDPGAAIGAVFIVAAGLWLIAQRASGNWVKLSSTTKWLWALGGACLLSCITSSGRVHSLMSTSKVLAGVLMFSVLEQYLSRRPDRVRWIVTCLFLSFIVPAVVGLHQWLSGSGTRYYVDVSRVSGTYPHPSSFAIYLLLIAPLAVMLVGYYRGWARGALVAIAGLSTMLTVVTYTRAAWAAVVVVVVYLGVKARPQLLLVFAGVVIVLLAAVPSFAGRFSDLKSTPVTISPGQAPPNSMSWRVAYWKQVLPLADKNPITGIGFTEVEVVEPAALPPHNGFVEAYVETGVVGLITICGVIVSLARALRRRLRTARTGLDRLLALAAIGTALGVLVQFPVENLLDQTFIYWYLAAAMTWGYTGWRRAKEPTGAAAVTADDGAPAGAPVLVPS